MWLQIKEGNSPMETNRRPKSRRWLLGTSAAAAAALGFSMLSAPAASAEPADDSGDDAPRLLQDAENPYAGAQLYVNPEWSAQAAANGGEAIADTPTAIWLDRIHAITDGSAGENTMGLADHLDEALDQGADAIQVVIYNLPGRDCAALASSGELGPDDIDIYENDYIDPIVEIMSDAAYADLDIITIIEIDSLPNLITNVGDRETATDECDEMLANGNYVNGVGYALGQLGTLDNTYNYMDIGHHGWLGWEDNFAPFADLAFEAANANGASPEDLHGFVSNVANYSALDEPHFDITDTAGDGPVRETDFISWNQYLGEIDYLRDYKDLMAQVGFPNTSMVIDTSRNGWGGSDRPDGPGDLTGPAEAFVDDSRIDRRYNKGNWCNQAGAGLGERPQANPTDGIDAYAWIKPPGESDGSSEEIDNDEGKAFDEMCDPAYQGNVRNQNNPSGALGDAPISGHWFQAQFDELIANAHPPLNGDDGNGDDNGDDNGNGDDDNGDNGGEGTSCDVSYSVASSWDSGFVADVQLSNNGEAPLTDWTLSWTAPSGVQVTNGWGATVEQQGNTVTATAPSWASTLSAGSSTTIGFQATGPADPEPDDFTCTQG
jgi:cellulose 1,4-beta-cellobiosidase